MNFLILGLVAVASIAFAFAVSRMGTDTYRTEAPCRIVYVLPGSGTTPPFGVKPDNPA